MPSFESLGFETKHQRGTYIPKLLRTCYYECYIYLTELTDKSELFSIQRWVIIVSMSRGIFWQRKWSQSSLTIFKKQILRKEDPAMIAFNREMLQLAEVLERLQTSDLYSAREPLSLATSLPTPVQVATTSIGHQEQTGYGQSTASHSRTAAYNLSTSGLLTNLTATCQQTNAKLNVLNDQLTRFCSMLDIVIQNQERQLVLLAAISRHPYLNKY